MTGRSRPYSFPRSFGQTKLILTIAFNDRCDASWRRRLRLTIVPRKSKRSCLDCSAAIRSFTGSSKLLDCEGRSGDTAPKRCDSGGPGELCAAECGRRCACLVLKALLEFLPFTEDCSEACPITKAAASEHCQTTAAAISATRNEVSHGHHGLTMTLIALQSFMAR